MTTVEYPIGMDLAWPACDSDGEIAIFYSAGPGPIPKVVPELTDEEFSSLEAFLVSLPIVCGAETNGEFKGNESFFEPARQGCYVFDWSDVHRGRGLLRAYERCAVPAKPLDIDALLPGIQTLLQSLTFVDIAFRDCPILDVEKHFECLWPPPDEPVDQPQQTQREKVGFVDSAINWVKATFSISQK